LLNIKVELIQGEDKFSQFLMGNK